MRTIELWMVLAFRIQFRQSFKPPILSRPTLDFSRHLLWMGRQSLVRSVCCCDQRYLLLPDGTSQAHSFFHVMQLVTVCWNFWRYPARLTATVEL